LAEQPVALLPLYKGWDNYQALLITAIEPLSLAQLALRPAPHLRSVGENAAHIVGARVGWLHYVLGRGDETLVAMLGWNQRDQPARPAAELVNGLAATWHVIEETLTHWNTADLAGIVHDSEDNAEYTRQWVIWHLIEHDVHHGGELSFTLGMHGLTGIDI